MEFAPELIEDYVDYAGWDAYKTGSGRHLSFLGDEIRGDVEGGAWAAMSAASGASTPRRRLSFASTGSKSSAVTMLSSQSNSTAQSVVMPFRGSRLYRGNKRRTKRRDLLSFSKLKDVMCPKWNLDINLSSKGIIGDVGLQTIREHTYMTAHDIDQYIRKSMDVYGNPSQFGTVNSSFPGAVMGSSGETIMANTESLAGLTAQNDIKIASAMVKCCMMSYTVKESFSNNSTNTVFLALWEVVPVTPGTTDFVTAWKYGLVENAPLGINQHIKPFNDITGPTVSHNDTVTVYTATHATGGSGDIKFFHGSSGDTKPIRGDVAEDRILVPRSRPPFSSLALKSRYRKLSYKLVTLHPGETYTHTMVFKPFCIDKNWHDTFANISPFRTRKLITATWGESATLKGSSHQFATTSSYMLDRKVRTLGSFRAMPFVKSLSNVRIGTGGLDINALPCFASEDNQNRLQTEPPHAPNPLFLSHNDVSTVNEAQLTMVHGDSNV